MKSCTPHTTRSICPSCDERHTELHPDSGTCWPCHHDAERVARAAQAKADGLAGVAAFETWLAGRTP